MAPVPPATKIFISEPPLEVLKRKCRVQASAQFPSTLCAGGQRPALTDGYSPFPAETCSVQPARSLFEFLHPAPWRVQRAFQFHSSVRQSLFAALQPCDAL